MALIKSVRGFTPEIAENCFLADNATIIGDVKIGNDCSIWFNTVLRGDVKLHTNRKRSKHTGRERATYIISEINYRNR